MAAVTPSKTDQEKAGSINDAPPTAIHNDYPPGFDATQVMGGEGEIIDYKTLTWWYVIHLRRTRLRHQDADLCVGKAASS